MTPWALLQQRVREDGASPLVTHYDDETGERVELSALSFANWVAKTANLLVDELDVEPGEAVALRLPAHWQSYVVGMAVGAVGAHARAAGDGAHTGAARATGDGADAGAAGAADGSARVTVTAEADLADDARSDTLVLSLRPMGAGRAVAGPGVDYATEVRPHGDYFPGGDGTGDELVEAARQRAAGLPARPRLLSADPEYDLVDDLLVALVSGGSVVLVRNEDSGAREHRLATERVTHVRAGGVLNPV